MKEQIRVLGIAESFMKNAKYSLITGVVMRGDLQVDGILFGKVTIGGLDATKSIINLIEEANRPDIRVIMLGGVIISLYNIIDLNELYSKLRIPVIAVTYHESEGIDNILVDLPMGTRRLEIYYRNGKRTPILLDNGYTVYVRFLGIKLQDVINILNKLTIHGRFPEPIRVAKIISRNVLKFISKNLDDVFNFVS